MALIPIFKGLAVMMNAIDFPNPRKVHTYPLPKIGGIAMALGTLVPVALSANGDRFTYAVIVGAWIVVIFGLIDDLKDYGYKFKLVGQILAAMVVITYGGLKIQFLGMHLSESAHLPDFVAIPLTLLAIVGVTNAINLSDGLDGLAGGSSLLIFICIGYLAYTGIYIPGNRFIVLMSVAAIGSIFGFLRFNTYPATVFMGDVGSQLLGFLVITLSLGLTQCNTPLSPFLPLLLLGFPVLDTLTVMVERISSGRSPFKADKNHFHHKLLRLGIFHTEAVVTIYVITAFLVSSAFVFRFHSEWFLLVFYLVFSGLTVCGFLIADRTGWRLRRFDLVDKAIKGRLRILKDKKVLIKVTSQMLELALPILLIVSGFMPVNLPPSFTIISMVALGLIIAVWVFKKKWLPVILRITFYLLIPLTLRVGQIDMAAWMTPRIFNLYSMAFGVLGLLVVFVLKFTRRQKGFKTTPTDLLILVIALVVPNLPDPGIQSFNMGSLATKIIVLFFSFEVLIGEYRGHLTKLTISTMTFLLLVAIRGIT